MENKTSEKTLLVSLEPPRSSRQTALNLTMQLTPMIIIDKLTNFSKKKPMLPKLPLDTNP